MPRNQSDSKHSLQVTRIDQRIWNQAIVLQEESNQYGDYSLPDPNKVLYSGAVLDSQQNVIGVGVVPLIAEAIIVVDSLQSTKDRARSIKLLLDEFKKGVRDLDGLHAFIQDPEFARILQKHFGFRKVKGEALYLEL